MLSATLENVLNRGLPRSPRAQQLCLQLAGRKIAIEARPFMRFVVESTGVSLKVSTGAGAADAELRGGPWSLLALRSAAPEEVVRRGDVQIQGDMALIEQFRELARLLQPDFEEELSQLVGDVPAHHAGRLVRGTLAWSRRTAATSVRNLAEYLAHESRDLVPR